MSTTKKIINNKKIDKCLENYGNNVTKKIIKETQDDHDPYEKKSKNDKLTCIVCNGKYTRGQKFIHDKTKKHQTQLQKIDFMINEAMIKNLVNKRENYIKNSMIY